MLSGWIRRARGQVQLRVESPFPERVLNLCGAHRLSFWEVAWESPECFTCHLSRQDFRRLQKLTEPLECVLTVVKREGAPYFFRRFRHRQTLVIGGTVAAMALFLGSFFVWDFRVEGNETVPEEQILRALEKCGVGIGSFGLSLDGEDIRNRVLLEIPELSWITVNVSGCRAQIQVRERLMKPKMENLRAPANVVARTDGLVERIQVLGGVRAVLPGMVVTKGQLLISGVEDTDTFGAYIRAGMGSVQARTWHTLTVNMPLTVREKQYTGREKTCWAVIFGRERIKFFSNSSIEGEFYDKLQKRYEWTLFGLPLPVMVEKEGFRFYELAEVQQEEAAAQRRGEELLRRRLEDTVAPYGTVISSECSARRRGEVLTVTLQAECSEEIGRSVPVYTEETGVD